jgi:hypothetical protein
LSCFSFLRPGQLDYLVGEDRGQGRAFFRALIGAKRRPLTAAAAGRIEDHPGRRRPMLHGSASFLSESPLLCFPLKAAERWSHPRCRASIRTLNGPPGPGACWGPISRPRSVTDDGPWDVRVLPSNRRSLTDQPTTRSHPNKAVDVASSLAMKKKPASRFEFRLLRCSRREREMMT